MLTKEQMLAGYLQLLDELAVSIRKGKIKPSQVPEMIDNLKEEFKDLVKDENKSDERSSSGICPDGDSGE